MVMDLGVRHLWNITATYHGLNELATPYFKVYFFGHVHGWKQFEEIQDGGLGLVKERCHFWRDGM
jgi:hypothetical protein